MSTMNRKGICRHVCSFFHCKFVPFVAAGLLGVDCVVWIALFDSFLMPHCCLVSKIIHAIYAKGLRGYYVAVMPDFYADFQHPEEP